MSSQDITVVKQAFEAFENRDLVRLEELSGANLIVENAVTGSAVGTRRYEGRQSLAHYFGDLERVWEDLKLHPRTFHSPRPGDVLVAGSVSARRVGAAPEVRAVAWVWRVSCGKITFVHILPGVAVKD